MEKSEVQAHLDSIEMSLNLIEPAFASATLEEQRRMYGLAKEMERINAPEHLRMQNLMNIFEHSGRRPVFIPIGGLTHGEQ